MRGVAWTESGAVLAMNRPAVPGVALPPGSALAAAAAAVTGLIEAPERWTTALEGEAGALAAHGDRVVAAEQVDPRAAALVLIDGKTGAIGKRVPILATGFVRIADVAVCEGGAVVAGSFGGTVRVGEQIVSTGGQRDGFVAALDEAGTVRQLMRMGGDGDDGFTAADCRPAGAGLDVAVVGTFSAGAELRGVELARLAAKSPDNDAVLVRLRDGAVTWQRSFGGSVADLPADVVFTGNGELAVVGMARNELVAGATTLEIAGAADGYLARWAGDGTSLGAVRLGGFDYDATTQLVPLGDRLAIAGFFSGSLQLGGTTLSARGGDDAMLVLVAPSGEARVIPIGGAGREELIGLAATPSGLVLGVSHTAGFDMLGLAAPSPADPLGGAAVVILPAL